MQITCKNPKALWERIGQLKGETKILKVDYEDNELISVTIKGDKNGRI